MKYRTRPRTAYIAGRFERRSEFIAAEKMLEEHNIKPGTRWLHLETDIRENDEDERKKFAIIDFEDVVNADFLITFSEDLEHDHGEPNGVFPLGTARRLYVPALWARGGRHVEFGIALASGLDIVVIGPMENIFHYYNDRSADSEPRIRHFDSIEDFVQWYDENNPRPDDAE